MTAGAAELQSSLKQLQECRGNPALLCHSPLAGDLVPVLYQGLRSIGRTERLDLVLSTYGGSVTAARQLALLLREFTGRLTILVPHRARSAGTLLCLSADELVLTAVAELGPLDANSDAAEFPGPGMPGSISAEDIRAFPDLARDWFGVESDGLQLLALLSQRIFPASLASFYRMDRLIRQTAGELLEFPFPDPADEQLRARIVEQLVTGYHAHDYVLTRADVRRLGLPVSEPGPDADGLLWTIARQLDRLGAQPAGSDGSIAGLVAGVGFLACNVIRRPAGDAEPGVPEWQVDG
ncbi:MAG TPA: hypothetical protein VFU36_17550 [Jatrophihabitans sp.]|nr:hypothetical protein [Jatrophihabitans sp.]